MEVTTEGQSRRNRYAPNPVHLKTLIAVVRTGSFADAARQLGYTSSAVSQQIAALERSLRVKLFERDARSIRPSDVAELLANRARAALAGLDSLLDDIDDLTGGVTGKIAIGSFPTANRALLPRALVRFRQQHPDVSLQLDESEPDDLIRALLAHEIDLAIVYDYDLVRRRWPADLKILSILDEELLLLIPESRTDLTRRSHLQLGELRDEIWISTRDGTAGAKCLQRVCAVGAEFEPRIELKSNDYDVIHAFVQSGFGIALVPALSYRQISNVCVKVLDEIKAKRHVYLLYRSSGTNPTLPKFIEQMNLILSEMCDDRYIGRVNEAQA